MAQRVETFRVTAPVSELVTTLTALSFTPGNVDRIELDFPDGCAGFVQLQVYCGANQVIPLTLQQVLTGNDETVAFDLDDYPPLGNWALAHANLDPHYAHTVTIRFWVTESVAPDTAGLPSILLLPLAGQS